MDPTNFPKRARDIAVGFDRTVINDRDWTLMSHWAYGASTFSPRRADGTSTGSDGNVMDVLAMESAPSPPEGLTEFSLVLTLREMNARVSFSLHVLTCCTVSRSGSLSLHRLYLEQKCIFPLNSEES